MKINFLKKLYQDGNGIEGKFYVKDNKKFKKLESELKNLTFNKVLEIKDLTRQEADKLLNLYTKVKDYIVRGPIQDSSKTNYSLYFELNPYNKNRKEK